jgi:hypothetical protein
MLKRVIGLIVLAVGSVACMMISARFANIMASAATLAKQEAAEYRSRAWLIAFGICAASWISLLVKTIRYRPQEFNQE